MYEVQCFNVSYAVNNFVDVFLDFICVERVDLLDVLQGYSCHTLTTLSTPTIFACALTAADERLAILRQVSTLPYRESDGVNIPPLFYTLLLKLWSSRQHAGMYTFYHRVAYLAIAVNVEF